ncbi:MAG: hypothetical protein H6936_13975 [Burkholderiales bacterium]|nr:hypothetical protein [Nitrosomonas sp.]MCP5275925.1 hypothetical protein [Burkholderiales bacterium]
MMEHILLSEKPVSAASTRRPVNNISNDGPARHALPVMQLLRNQRIQAKLKISQPSDVLEQEAGRVADHVMNTAAPQGLSQTNAHSESPQYRQLTEIQRLYSSCGDELQRKENGEAYTWPGKHCCF